MTVKLKVVLCDGPEPCAVDRVTGFVPAGVGVLMLTLAVPDEEEFAWDVAAMAIAPVGTVAGAVNRPLESMVPAEAVHVTAVLLVFVTLAVNC